MKNGVKKIQTAGYNGASTVYNIFTPNYSEIITKGHEQVYGLYNVLTKSSLNEALPKLEVQSVNCDTVKMLLFLFQYMYQFQKKTTCLFVIITIYELWNSSSIYAGQKLDFHNRNVIFYGL